MYVYAYGEDPLWNCIVHKRSQVRLKTQIREEYAKPLHGGRLLFAGEGTNVEHPACVDGAYETGARAAKEAAAVIGGNGGENGRDGWGCVWRSRSLV